MSRVRIHVSLGGPGYWVAPDSILDVVSETEDTWTVDVGVAGGAVIRKPDTTLLPEAYPPETALSKQVGGSHYKDLAIQPAEYTTRNGIGHLAGDAIAYITCYKRKNGREDLEKAIHSIQLLITLEYPEA